MPRAKRIGFLLLAALGTFPEVPSAQQQPTSPMRVLTIAPQAEVRYAAPWTPSAVKYSNAQELVVTRETRLREPSGQEEVAQAVVARTLITTEQRLNHEDAVKRLEDIAASRNEPARFLEIGGWPAVEIEFAEPLPRRGKGDQFPLQEVVVQRTITAIAADDQLVRFDISLMPEAPAGMREEAKELTRNTRFGRRGNPQQIEETLRRLRVETERRKSVRPPAPEAAIEGGPELLAAGEAAGGVQRSGAPVSVQNGVGELEIVMSGNANNVVLASNQGLSFSTNRGASFAAGASGVFGLNDPSLARAASGNFYLAVIAFPNGTPAHLNATGCTNAVSRSTDNGANFGLRGYSARCPQTGAGVCFPDQEHIAADAVNPSGGNDQIYAVWRNFTPAGAVANCGGIGSGFVTSSITCSQDNGTNWTATAAIAGAGDFPRVAVGRDGAVYVVTLNGNNVLLHRFTSCANGLTQEAGFPVTVATLTGGVTCPVSGLDRCNDGNTLSSPTVAPDPANANHLFVSFAERDGSTGERIVVRESHNRGASFQPAINVSGGPSARRFLPWVCSTGGSAWVGWYDRRAATAGSNDLTDYFVGTTRGFSWNLSNNPDPQCASGWPCAPRSTNDSEACSAQPQAAGVCRPPGGGGSGTRCDFSGGGCPAGETCQGGGGCPKYGDYNGIACAGDHVIAAWSSATTPAGLAGGTGLRVFSSTLCVARDGAAVWRHTGTPCSGDSCPGWARLDNNPRTISIAADGSQLYQLHNNGAIWRSTGATCDCGSCPGWTRLDNNSKTVALAAAGGHLYQLHNDGWIWRHTGTPCSGDSCPGWQRLDRNSKTVAIAATGNHLYQLHNDGWIWRYTGTPCSGDSCPGWQRLDRNPKTVSIAAGGDQLYQLHNDGWIWRYTGTPCSGDSCPGWQRLDRNSKTVAIAAGNQLYQLHNDGWIWRYTGTPCSGDSCPGWQRLDRNSKTIAIAASGDQLYQQHNDGWIWRYTGTPCSGESCPGWQRLDNNPRTGIVAAGNSLYQLHTDPLYQLHNDGWIWRFTGTECEGVSCPGWERLDRNGNTREIVAAGSQLYQRHVDGRTWRYNGTPCSGDSCPGWQLLDVNPKTVSIAAGGNQLYQRHNDGWIWRYTGTPCTGTNCPGWQRLDRNPKTVAIAASGNRLFQLHNDGWIWSYTGTPCTGDSCPGWQRLDRNPNTRSIVATESQLFQLHSDGRIWRYTGVPCTGDSCPGWQPLDNNSKTVAIVAAGKQLFQLHNDGWIWRYTGVPCTGTSCPGWERLDRNPSTRQILASGGHLYQRHSDGKIWRYVGPPCSGDNCPGWRLLDNNSKTVGIVAGGFN